MIKSVEEKCFSAIDKHASQVLESDEFEDIELKLLKDIITRDSLQIQSGEIKFICSHFRLINFFQSLSYLMLWIGGATDSAGDVTLLSVRRIKDMY